MEYRVNGILHRTDGPAYITKDVEMWFYNGKRHRENGPAVITATSQTWYRNGKIHRSGSGGSDSGCDDGGPALIKPGNRTWYFHGMIHRLDGPACIIDGVEYWMQYGKIHRENDEPAVIRPDGTLEYYNYNVRHRVMGPTIIRPDGTEEYYQNGLRHGERVWIFEGKCHHREMLPIGAADEFPLCEQEHQSYQIDVFEMYSEESEYLDMSEYLC